MNLSKIPSLFLPQFPYCKNQNNNAVLGFLRFKEKRYVPVTSRYYKDKKETVSVTILIISTLFIITQNRAGAALTAHQDSNSPEDESSFLLTLATSAKMVTISLSLFLSPFFPPPASFYSTTNEFLSTPHVTTPINFLLLLLPSF